MKNDAMDYFKNILVPVDLTVNTEVAVEKAIELADRGGIIHLLHVHRLKMPYTYRLLAQHDELHYRDADKLDEWKRLIQQSVNGIEVCTWISTNGSIQEAIERKAKQLRADLIIIGKNSHYSWFPFLNTLVPSEIAQSTEIPVLTVKPGSLNNSVKAIVVPIASGSPDRKIEVISVICKKFTVRIYLVSFMNNNTPSDFNSSSLLTMYQRIRSFSHCPVEYAVLHGGNKAKAVLDYAKKMDADMLLVSPDAETKIGWPSKYISDVLPATSKVQVLAV
ncbi:MAG: universal stress protein [Chitinophagaceae bacterium]